jgi:hypothetical protein
MLHLIKMWLETPAEETDERGNKHRSTQNRDERRGTPQEFPISSGQPFSYQHWGGTRGTRRSCRLRVSMGHWGASGCRTPEPEVAASRAP